MKNGHQNEPLVIPVILCGGSGTRLWPVSRELQPKQFLNLMGDFSLLQDTVRRALRISGAEPKNLVTVSLEKLKWEVTRHISEIDPTAAQHILSEPSARNTAAAVAYAAAYVMDNFGEDAIMWILPADHHIGDEVALGAAFREGLTMAKNNYLVTFGIRPSRPETGYGYIHLGQPIVKEFVYKAESFVEKPDQETAQKYLESGDYLWNSGMFMFRAETVLTEFNEHSPVVLSDVIRAMAASDEPTQPDPELYSALPVQPFDKAIMEKSNRVVTIPCDPSWSDIGSWESVWEIREKDTHGNVVEGRAACHDTRGCLILGQKRLIACAGLDNIVVVETEDAILIADRRNPDAMKVLVRGLKESGYKETLMPASNQQSSEMEGDAYNFDQNFYKQTTA